jgi:hypothetical protein
LPSASRDRDRPAGDRPAPSVSRRVEALRDRRGLRGRCRNRPGRDLPVRRRASSRPAAALAQPRVHRRLHPRSGPRGARAIRPRFLRAPTGSAGSRTWRRNWRTVASRRRMSPRRTSSTRGGRARGVGSGTVLVEARLANWVRRWSSPRDGRGAREWYRVRRNPGSGAAVSARLVRIRCAQAVADAAG